MNGAQGEAVEALRAMMPGASFRPFQLTRRVEAIYGLGSIAVGIERETPGDSGPVGSVILDKAGTLTKVHIERRP